MPPIIARTRCNCACSGPGLGNGLLTVDGEDWRAQRRALAPLFSARQIPAFAPAMHRVAAAAVERLAPKRDGRVIDASGEMARITLQVLEQTLFSQGLGRDASEFQVAVTRYFDTIGRIDPLDLLGAPQFLPRLGRLRGRATLEFFARAVDDIIGARKKLLASGASPPNDILTLAACARRTRKPARASAKTTCAPISSPSSAPAMRRPPTL